MRRGSFVMWMVCACGSATSPATTTTHATPADWHPSATTETSLLHVRVDPQKNWTAAATTIIGDMCSDAVLVWGDVKIDESVRARAVDISVASSDDKPILDGFLVCMSQMETFLKLQVSNPRIAGGRGGTADVKWREGQLFMRRRWSAADIPLGHLDPPPPDIFQKGEALAALVSLQDASVHPIDLLTTLARVPKVFVFGMFILR